MAEVENILIGKGENRVTLQPKYANRHGLIAGATGTGKTITLQVLAEGFSRIGVPVFMADVKGDLSGISQEGSAHPKVEERVKHIGIDDFAFDDNSCVFWDLFGDKGHPVRATISDMGPTLLSQLLGLNDTQAGIMTVVFRFADDEGLLLLDLKDLTTTLKFISDNAKQFKADYGNISSASVGAIQRRLIELEESGADEFFGEPQLDLWDLMRVDSNGRGNINILAADKLMMKPKLYATFLLWLISELFEDLPEVGDQEKPRLVFFFDEAHLLFEDAPKALVEKVEMVVRLIRSKGIGIYFITQSPLDIPEDVLGQLGNRVQHALRAFTPKDKKAVRATAQTMRENPSFDSETAIMELGVGEALVSTLEEDGIPSIVERTMVRPPVSRIGPVTEAERGKVLKSSPFAGRYDKEIDRESAHEKLKARVQKIEAPEPASGPALNQFPTAAQKAAAQQSQQKTATTRATAKPKGRQRQTVTEALTKSVVRSIGSSVGRQIGRGLLGGIMGTRRRR